MQQLTLIIHSNVSLRTLSENKIKKLGDYLQKKSLVRNNVS